MAQPTPYTRSTNFNDYSTSNPSSPHQGSSLDAEFNALKTTTDQIRSNIAVIQRDDGKLANLSVHAESLSNAVLTLIKATSNGYGVKGAWTADTAYAIGDLVESSQATYLCFEAHTSGSTFGANSSKFILLANAAIQTTASAVDKFSGDASTQVFTLTNNTPSGETDVLVFVNGSLLEPTTAYTVTSSQISFTTAPSQGTNNVIVWGTSTAVEAAKQAALSARDTAETHKDDANEHKQTANLWANKVDGTVTDVDSGVDSGEYSAKAYASSTDSDEPPTGSAKSWASQDTTAVASSLFSAKEYASGTSATGGTAKQWATKDDGAVASSEYSSKAYANSTDSNEPTTGSSKNWATKTASAEVQSGQGYSSKTYAQDTTASADTTGGSAKGWASTAEDTAVPGASSSDYSAKHWAAKAENQATNATNQNRFLAPASSDPTTRADNSALQTGDFYFNTNDNKMKVRNDATPPAWQDTSSSISSVASIEEFTASDGQGTDSKYFAVVHDVGLEIVWLNGVRLKRGDDYICTNTNSDTTARSSGNSANFVKLETVPGSNDILSIMAFGQIDNNLAVNVAGGTFTGGVTFEAGTTHNTGSNTFTMPTTRGTDGYVLTRDDSVGTGGTAWKETITAPSITNISGEINEDTNTTLTVTGSGFASGMTIKLINSSSGADITGHTTLSYTGSSSPLTVTIPSATTNITAGTSVKLHINKQGLTTTSSQSIVVSEDPNWVSPADNSTIATILSNTGTGVNVGSPLSANAGANGGTINYVIDSSDTSATTYFDLGLTSGQITTDASNTLSNILGGANSATETFIAYAQIAGEEATKKTPRTFNIIVNKPPIGGTIIEPANYNGNYRSHKFLNAGNGSSTNNFVLYAPTVCDILMVGGGGGGGYDQEGDGGGGGAGGMRVISTTLSAGTYTISVGAGGNGGSSPSVGGDTTMTGQTASAGGGYGGSQPSSPGANGGSGGGGGGETNTSGGTGAGSLGTNGNNAGYYGGDGGTGNDVAGASRGGAGGGGASQDGGDADSTNGGHGGEGLQNNFETGNAQWYAAGGSGGHKNLSNTAGPVINGISGKGGDNYATSGSGAPSAGVDGTGAGGGGGYATTAGQNSGGDGVVIIRYAT